VGSAAVVGIVVIVSTPVGAAPEAKLLPAALRRRAAVRAVQVCTSALKRWHLVPDWHSIPVLQDGFEQGRHVCYWIN
jgi:hypothetical protein